MKYIRYVGIFLVALSLIASGAIVAAVSMTPSTNESVLTTSAGIDISPYSKSIIDFRVLVDLGDSIYLVEVNVDTRVKNIIRPGKYMQVEIPHLVKLNTEEISRLYEADNK